MIDAGALAEVPAAPSASLWRPMVYRGTMKVEGLKVEEWEE